MTNKVCTHTAVGITLSVLGGKWKPLILWHVRKAPMRFSQLMRAMDGITPKMLTQQLRELEHDRLITRTVKKQVPPHVEYSLSTYGRTIETVLQVMHQWGEKHHRIQKKKT